ncbi:phosphatidylserine/phosphatidylglycerophosphate/cardiolipin synthase family protein [Terriglobus albidus]|uniref:Phosphatidylserine/phosphatidylglycerophosphate/ cardiolipin synthase family protein n=1 Tax=Terriglobus albidus TaxID=1592106 RepID=A0A5B9EE76_9BACT|nr:phosphatidylserine/phosphatidylglycerophosphate/cardiolipin synthase family protein [Terriglobus albidus]QEE30453.1 phosphatidylserine/phosphatidylglycerophosphate/cardiolipin synthase family protein [Terriglobus albidus]
MTSIAIPFVQSGSYPTRSGNLVRPLIDGEPAFRRICEVMETARRSIWVTVTFMWQACEMPDGRGTPFDVLDRAAAQGIDVRIIFWRPDEETAWLRQNAFWGSTTHTDLLSRRRSGVKIRWDRAEPGFCQHQKSWLVDAGAADGTAFVGGINLNPHSMVAPGHRGEGHNHDVYLELAGPSVVDVHHNFVQRWNEASERLTEEGRWGTGSEVNLQFPNRVPAERGAAFVQIQRTMHSGRYADGQATPDGAPYDIASGERSNFEQYCAAILAARRSIYIENQQIDVPEILDCLHRALTRGVEVVLLVPSDPEVAVQTPLELPASLRPLAKFRIFDNFMVAGIAGTGADGHRKSVYVHSKLMLVDDAWATVGSCNLHRFSLFGNSEMNAAFSDPRTVRTFRCELLQEHLDQDTSGVDDRSALRLFREIARQNRKKLEAGDYAWQGLAFELELAP